jgi:hypothetical protein
MLILIAASPAQAASLTLGCTGILTNYGVSSGQASIKGT